MSRPKRFGVDSMKKSEKALWSAHLFVDCPYCGEQQDLLDYAGDPRIDFNIEVAECDTKRTTDIETDCADCGEEFIVPGLVW